MIESKRQAELEAEGWTACFVADEPRLGEAVELYKSLGKEVHLEPVQPDSAECATCLEYCLDRFKMIYTRPAGRQPTPEDRGDPDTTSDVSQSRGEQPPGARDARRR